MGSSFCPSVSQLSMLDFHYLVPCTLHSFKGPKFVTWSVKRYVPCSLERAAVKWTSPSWVFSLKDDFQFSLYTCSDPRIYTISLVASKLALGGAATIFVLCFSQKTTRIYFPDVLRLSALFWVLYWRGNKMVCCLSNFLDTINVSTSKWIASKDTVYFFPCKLCLSCITSLQGQIECPRRLLLWFIWQAAICKIL